MSHPQSTPKTPTPESLALSASLFHSSISDWIPKSFGHPTTTSSEDLSILLRSAGQDDRYDRLGLGHALLSAPKARAGPGPSTLRHLEGRLRKVDRGGSKGSADTGSTIEKAEEEGEDESRARMVGRKRKMGIVDMLGGKKGKKLAVSERTEGKGRAVLRLSSSDTLLLKPLFNGSLASAVMTDGTSTPMKTDHTRTTAHQEDNLDSEPYEDRQTASLSRVDHRFSTIRVETPSPVSSSNPRTAPPNPIPPLPRLNPSKPNPSPQNNGARDDQPSISRDSVSSGNSSSQDDIPTDQDGQVTAVGGGEERQRYVSEEAMGEMELPVIGLAEGRSKSGIRREKRKKAREKRLKGQAEV